MKHGDATEGIFQKLCEKFKLDGENDWESAFALGGELGYSENEIRNALWIFVTDGRNYVEVDGISIGQIRLTTLGEQRCKSSLFPCYRL
jgi:hypothetical protein